MFPDLAASRECGLRERKKRRTRLALMAAAADLFERKGYAETTVAEIAAAAEVSTRTFFSYFASKEDILFWDSESCWRAAADAVSQHGPAESPAEALLRAVTTLAGRGEDEVQALAEVRLRLLPENPVVQASALQRIFMAEREIARRLHAAYPGALDAVAAGALVGALVGALAGAFLAMPEGRRMTGADVRLVAERALGLTTPPG